MSNAPDLSADNPYAPGSVLAGKYRIERILGKGGMGLVIEARHIDLDERVALKFLLPEFAKQPEASKRFQNEARAAVKIKSEHVARVSDVSTLADGAPYMVMEFLEGHDLSWHLVQTGVFSIHDAVDFVIQGCEAIAEAHSLGIVHRDIKPANLFLSNRRDGSPIVKVLDFGISKDKNNTVDNLTRTTASMGSALYMSPEQMQQTRSVDHRTDVYALGISLYELLAGKQPFVADTLPQLCAEILTGIPTPLRKVRPDIPEPLAAVIERAYARDRANRYQSVADFVVALAPFAPPRTQSSIERIARMGGIPIPSPASSSGVFATPAYATSARPPSSPALPTPASTPQPAPAAFQATAPAPPPPVQQAPASLLGTKATVPLPVMDPTTGEGAPPGAAPVPPPPGSSPQIVPGPYSAPMSLRAAANFAQGQTSSNLATTGGLVTAPNQFGKLLAVAIAVLALGGIGAAVLWRVKNPAAQPGASSASVAPTVMAPPPSAGTSTVAPAAPNGSASAQPSDPGPTSASATPAPPDTATSASAQPTAHTHVPPSKGGAGTHVAPGSKGGLLTLDPSVYGAGKGQK